MPKQQTNLSRPKPALTLHEVRVLDFIRAFQLREGLPPTRQEIATGLSLKTVMRAQRAVQKLKEHGRLTFDTQSKRGIRLTDPIEPQTEIITIPLLGTVAAGRPIEAIESDQRLQVPASLVRGTARHFALRVQGDSMIEDHILDGDFVILREQADADNGAKVVALIDHAATLKRLYRKPGRVELHPANANLKPIVVESHQHLRIAGVYVGLIRIER